MRIPILLLVTLALRAEPTTDPWLDLVNRGISELHQGRYIEAELSFRDALELAPTDQRNRQRLITSYQLGRTLMLLQRYSEAEPLLSKASEGIGSFGPKYDIDRIVALG